ncbi:hypothetical protein R6Q59_003005 [Mikania micrantha]
MAAFKLNPPSNHHFLINTKIKMNSSWQVMKPFTAACTTSSTTISTSATIIRQIANRLLVHDNRSCRMQAPENWSSLLEPMDPALRSELIRCGEMAQACYEAFDNNPYSKYCGSCKVPPKTFFRDLGMDSSGYEMTSYIYSSNTSNLVPKFFIKSIKPDGPWNSIKGELDGLRGCLE